MLRGHELINKISIKENLRYLTKLNLVKITLCDKVLGLSQFLLMPQLPHDAHFKSGQKRLENIILLC